MRFLHSSPTFSRFHLTIMRLHHIIHFPSVCWCFTVATNSKLPLFLPSLPLVAHSQITNNILPQFSWLLPFPLHHIFRSYHQEFTFTFLHLSFWPTPPQATSSLYYSLFPFLSSFTSVHISINLIRRFSLLHSISESYLPLFIHFFFLRFLQSPHPKLTS